MELHEQQQRHLEPDVVPTPYSKDSNRAASGGNDASKSGCVQDERASEECGADTAPTTSSIREPHVHRKTDTRVAVRSPSTRARSASSEQAEAPVCAPSYNFGQYPVTMTCPCCEYTILTYVQYDISTKQYMACVFLCVCFMWPCSLIPCLFRGMYDVYHFCPVCRQLIGVYKA